jgi:hypothetical protein
LPFKCRSEPDDYRTLGDIIFPKAIREDHFLPPKDERLVELLLALSLLHLHANHWLQENWQLDNVWLHYSALGSTAREQWRPYLSWSLRQSGDIADTNDNAEDKILSFGLLMMELGLKKKFYPSEEDIDWETSQPSKRMMLQRALKTGERILDDGYRQIGDACIRFQELAEELYHPALKGKQKHTAAIYKYILVPLWLQIQNSFRDISSQFEGFPAQRESYLGVHDVAPNPIRRQAPSKMILFDDENDEGWHDPT